MGKLKSIIHKVLVEELKKYNFSTKKTYEDPITNSTEWDVNYDTIYLPSLLNDLKVIVNKLKTFEKINSNTNLAPIIRQGQNLINSLSKHIKNKPLKETSSSFTPGKGSQYASPKFYNSYPNLKQNKNIYNKSKP
jgi:hypothetical protein